MTLNPTDTDRQTRLDQAQTDLDTAVTNYLTTDRDPNEPWELVDYILITAETTPPTEHGALTTHSLATGPGQPPPRYRALGLLDWAQTRLHTPDTTPPAQ